MHPTIKFTADQKLSIFFDVTVSFIEEVVETDLYVETTDSHHCL